MLKFLRVAIAGSESAAGPDLLPNWHHLELLPDRHNSKPCGPSYLIAWDVGSLAVRVLT